jgi:tripartite-type tricarboxylate transporter receptor subunit TctC
MTPIDGSGLRTYHLQGRSKKVKSKKVLFSLFAVVAVTSFFFTLSPISAIAQDFPTKPITLYCGFAAGGTVDLVARSLASGVEKLLGVPVVVETKAGGSSTLCAGLTASKKPDGYTLGIVTSDAVTRLPDLIKVPYDPLKDFTWIGQYVSTIGGLVVHADSPIKTAQEFITYAKAHPGMTYGSSGINSHQGIPIELFAKCKGLQLKEIPYSGGAESVTQMLGKHTDFLCGSGSHIPYVVQGKFRMLFVDMTDKRDPDFPNVPTLKELGCPDIPPNTHLILAPKGMPDAIANKLADAFKKVSEGAEFQKLLKQIQLPYNFKTRVQLDKDIPAEVALYKDYHKKSGTKKSF